MATPPKIRPERVETDESLRLERDRTDDALARSQGQVERDADGVVERARQNADAVLDAARDKADLSAPVPSTALAEARAVEDDVLRDERATADERLRRERAASVQALAKLLPFERDETDRTLLTERERSDEDLSHRDDFLGIVAHDVRNLLGAIALSGESIEANAGEVTWVLKEVARIQRYVVRMNRLIGDLVDVASIDAGKLTIQRAPTDLTTLVAEAVEAFASSARAKRIELATDLDRPLLAELDHDRIFQVLANLITNAIKFTAEGGTIRVRGQRTADGVSGSVSDTGVGIPAAMREAVFDRFWQVGEHDRRGVGLGLYISRSLVLAHGGQIWVDSTVGQGSTFTFTLPDRAPST